MFSLKLFRLKPFNRKLVSNLIKSNAINARLVSNSVGFGHNPEPIDRSSSRITDPKNWADRQSRKEMLFEIFVMSCNVSKNNKRITELINENDLEALCDSAEAAIDDMFNRELINCLHSFLAMGLDPNSKIIQSLENRLLWRAKRFTLKELLECLSFHFRYQSTELQKKAVNELTVNLVLKLDTASDAKDIVQMFSLWRSLNPEIIEKMETIAIEMLGLTDNHFDMDSLSYVLILLSQMNRRTLPLITAIVNRFTYSTLPAHKTSEKNIINMISALNRLNYPDVNFLRKASNLLCNNRFLNKVKPSDRRDLLVSVSQLNWSDPRLLDQFVDKITDTNNDLSPQDFLVLVSSFARLYSGSVYLNEILSYYVIPYVRREDFDCESWLVYVWSLSLLGCVPLRCVHSVLNHEFYDQLMAQTKLESTQTHNYKQVLAKLKLLNIKAVAEIEMNETIDLEVLSTKDYVIAKRELSVEKLKNSTLKTLRSLVSNVSTNVLTPFGFAIDAEFVVNQKFISFPVQELSRSKAIPDGFKRCALMCFGFNDSILNDSRLVGVHELAIRLLKRLGYTVIAVNEREIPSYLKDHQKSERLKALISRAIESQ